MAKHTWVDLNIAEAERLADLTGVLYDFDSAYKMALELKAASVKSLTPNGLLVEAYTIAIVIRYCRPFVTGVRARLEEQDLSILSPELRCVHNRLRAIRDKHIAHSVNAFEENQPSAEYCVERFRDEGITSIGCSHSWRYGMPIAELDDVIALTAQIAVYVEALIAKEKERLLAIVRAMALETVLAGGRNTFLIDPEASVIKSRKRAHEGVTK